MEDENIVKKVCKELGITQKELAERIGYSESIVRQVSSNGNVSEPMKKAIDLLLENNSLRDSVKDLKTLADIIKKHS